MNDNVIPISTQVKQVKDESSTSLKAQLKKAKDLLAKTKSREDKRRSKSLKGFHVKARISIKQVEVLKQLILETTNYTEVEIDDLLDSIEDPGSNKSKRSNNKKG